MANKFAGLFAAPYTPFGEDGSLNPGMIGTLAENYWFNGVNGVFACGTTGEALSLTVEEREQACESWVAAGKEHTVIMHIGHLSLPDAKRLAAHAEQTGVDAIACGAPCYHRAKNIEDLVAFCAEVADAAPKTPFFYYHIPFMTHVNFPMIDFLREGTERIPTLQGMKFTNSDLNDFNLCLNFEGGRFEILFGQDEMFLAAASLGTRGFVGALFNHSAPVFRRILEAVEGGNTETARREQARATEVSEILERYGGVAAGKAVMKMIGLDCGPLRLPQRGPSESECETLRAELDGVGFFSFCSAAD